MKSPHNQRPDHLAREATEDVHRQARAHARGGRAAEAREGGRQGRDADQSAVAE